MSLRVATGKAGITCPANFSVWWDAFPCHFQRRAEPEVSACVWVDQPSGPHLKGEVLENGEEGSRLAPGRAVCLPRSHGELGIGGCGCCCSLQSVPGVYCKSDFMSKGRERMPFYSAAERKTNQKENTVGSGNPVLLAPFLKPLLMSPRLGMLPLFSKRSSSIYLFSFP